MAIAATTQIGDQGLTLGRSGALLAGLPDLGSRLPSTGCAGALTAATTVASGIGVGASRRRAGRRVEHGKTPHGRGVDPNPRFLSERLVDPEGY